MHKIIFQSIEELISNPLSYYDFHFDKLVKDHIKYTNTKKVFELILPNLKKYNEIYRDGDSESIRCDNAYQITSYLLASINILVKYGSVMKYNEKPFLHIYNNLKVELRAILGLRRSIIERSKKPLLMRCVYFIRNNRHLYQYDIFKLYKDLRVYFI